MAVIRCKACGRLYNYREEGLCPGCGAYNRPPKRERVNADGTVQHMTDAAYEKRRRAQEKVCFERKECHEDQARRGRQRAAEISAAPIARTGGKGRKSPVRSIILTVIAIVILYRLVGSLSGMFSRRAELSDESTFPYIDPVEIDPGDEDPVVSEFDAAMGDEVIMSDGIAFIVREWERSDEDEALVVILEPIFDEDSDSYYTDHYYTASLMCANASGGQELLTDFSTEQEDEEKLALCFATPRYAELYPTFLELCEWDSGDNLLLRWTVELW